MTPRFSILMTNFNKAPYIADAIRSVLSQTFGGWELLIYDDASNDGSVEAVRPFLRDHRIKLLQGRENIGTARAHQELLKLAAADLIGILDSDDSLDCLALEKVLARYDASPETGVIYTNYYYCNSDLVPVHAGCGSAIPPNTSNLHSNVIVAWRTFRRSVYEQSAGLDNSILYAEDIDLMLKLEELAPVAYVGEPLYYYRVLPESQTHSFRKTQINRSSTALAKLNAYQRRRNSDMPNLSQPEIAEVLFFGAATSILAGRIRLAKRFIRQALSIHPFFLLDPRFYWKICSKIVKLIKLKLAKPLVSLIR